MCVRCLGLVLRTMLRSVVGCGLVLQMAQLGFFVYFVFPLSRSSPKPVSRRGQKTNFSSPCVHAMYTYSRPHPHWIALNWKKKVLVRQSCFARTRNEPCRPLRPRRHQRKRRCHRHRGISSNLGRRAGERRRHLEEDWKPDPAEDGGEPRRGGSSVDVFGIPRRRFDQRDGDCCGWWVDNSSRDLARRSGELV